jgi:hypothetical protein
MSVEPEPVFRRDGDRFVPTASATGPWGADRLHGGPVLGLIARAIEASAPDPDLVMSRLTLDLFRPVPLAPLTLRIEPLRQGSRLWLLQGALHAGSEELARATALLLRASDVANTSAPSAAPPPAGPDDLPTESLMRGFKRDRDGFPPGFHNRVQTRWVPRADGDPLAIWFHLPIALVEGEQASPFQHAVALSDFANAVASIAAQERDRAATPYINADGTLYLTRRPQGEWFCLREQATDAERGVSVTETLLYDTAGAFGRVLQARLANRYQR